MADLLDAEGPLPHGLPDKVRLQGLLKCHGVSFQLVPHVVRPVGPGCLRTVRQMPEASNPCQSCLLSTSTTYVYLSYFGIATFSPDFAASMARPKSWPRRSHSLLAGPLASAHCLNKIAYCNSSRTELDIGVVLVLPIQTVQEPGDTHGRLLDGHVLNHLLQGDLGVRLGLCGLVLRAAGGAA